MKGMSFLIILVLCVSACKTQKKASEKSTENYMLEKVDAALVEKYWKLTELDGNPVIVNDNQAKEAHIIFKTDGRFNGDAGCNRITGSYRTEKSGRITFSQTASTKMMCLNMDTETKFLKMLETADSYTVQNDTLVLNKARMAPLARFVAVYLK